MRNEIGRKATRLKSSAQILKGMGLLLLSTTSMGNAQVARTITNASFETPTIAAACQGYVYENRVPGWKTADKLVTSSTADFDNPNGCVGTNTMPAAGNTRVFEYYSNQWCGQFRWENKLGLR